MGYNMETINQNINIMQKKLFVISCLLLVAGLSFTSVYAADYLPKDKTGGGNVVVGGDTVFNNLYVGGATVVVNKKVSGDLFVGGGSVNVAGSVQKDLFLAGGNITVSEPVGEDARLVGGNIALNAPIGGDLLVAGGTITIAESATVGGDLWVAGGAINLNSRVAGEARIAGGDIYINSEIVGPLTVRAGEKLTFGPKATVSGPINYYGQKEATIENGASVGAIEFTQWKSANKSVRGFSFLNFGWFILAKLLALFISALVIFKLFRTKVIEIVSLSYTKPWSSLGIGFVGFIVAVIASILLCVTVIGAYLGIAFGIVLVFFMIMSGPVVIIYTGYITEKVFKRGTEVIISWKTILWGTLVGTVLTLIPIIGWLAILILYMISFGTMLRVSRRVLEV